MYFVSRGGRFYAFFIQLKPWKRYTLTAVTLTSFTLCWYYGMYMPLEDLIGTYQQRLTNAEEARTMAQNTQTKLENQRKQLYRLQGQLKKKLPSVQEVTPVNTLVHYAQKAGLALQSCSCSGYQDFDWYKEASLLFDAIGSTDQLITFFDLLTQSTRIYGCSSIEIKQFSNKSLFQIRCLFSECLGTNKNPST